MPRGTDEGQILLNKDLTQASKWMGQQCDAEDNEYVSGVPLLLVLS